MTEMYQGRLSSTTRRQSEDRNTVPENTLADDNGNMETLLISIARVSLIVVVDRMVIQTQ